MASPFPLAPAPSYFAKATWKSPGGLGYSDSGGPGLVGTGMVMCGPFQAATSGTITNIYMYLDGNGGTPGTQVFRGVVYLSAAGEPTTLVSRGAEITVTSGDAAAWRASAATGTITAGQSYWVGMIFGNTSSVSNYYATTITNAMRYTASVTYPTAPSPVGTVGTSSTQMLGYVVYSGAPSIKRNGVFRLGDTVTIPLNKVTGATSYEIRNQDDGTIVDTGSLAGTEQIIPVATPSVCGSYRAYGRGPTNDAVFGTSYWLTNFQVAPAAVNFPAMPASTTTVTDAGGESSDLVAKGVLGIGTSRIVCTDVTAVDLSSHVAMATGAASYWSAPAAQYVDAARPRYLWCATPGRNPGGYATPAVDQLHVANYLNFYCKDGSVDGSKVTVALSSSSGTACTITVVFNATTTETYTVTTAADAVTQLAASAYVRAFTTGSGTASNLTATAIGHGQFTGLANVVSTLYAVGVTRYEGPMNEPDNYGYGGAEVAHQFLLYTAAVHSGNASAKAIGPCAIGVGPSLTFWKAFLTACTALSFTPDGLSTHAYGASLEGAVDINLFRSIVGTWKTLLTDRGFGSLEIWQTESTQARCARYGVYHANSAKVPLMQTLLWEQQGVRKELNNCWYDTSHGFDNYPAWWQNRDGSLHPQALMFLVLADQIFGKTHNQQLDFGTPGNYMFVGSVFAGAAGKVVEVMTDGYIPGANVTFTTSATGPVTWVDSWGNTSTVAVSNGRFTLNVREIPRYVQLGASDTVSVYSWNNSPPVGVAGFGNDTAPYASWTVGTTPVRLVSNYGFLTNYGNGTTTQAGIYISPNALPEAITGTWPAATRVDRVLVRGGDAWQHNRSPLTFTVDTSADGSAWTTRATVDVSSEAVSFFAASDDQGTGTERDTYWREQVWFDVKLPAPVTCKALRVNVSNASWGGAPDEAALTTGDQGDSPVITVQRVIALCDDNVNPHYATIV